MKLGLFGGSFDPTAIEFTVSGPEVVTSTKSFPLDPDYLGELREACK